MNPKENFFSQEGTNPKELGSFPRHLVSVELYCSVQFVWYNSGTDFEKKKIWARFSRREFFSRAQKFVQSVLSTGYKNQGGHANR